MIFNLSNVPGSTKTRKTPCFADVLPRFSSFWLHGMKPSTAQSSVRLWGKSRSIGRLWGLFPALLLLAPIATCQDTAAFYQKNCAACHSIGGGPRVGPDLINLLQRRDRAWLVRFMENPKSVVDSGDEYARNLVTASHGLVMPAVAGLDAAKADALLDFIGAGSKQGAMTSSLAPSAAERPFTAVDIERGRELVLGHRSLDAGGAACISCHNVSGLAGMGGGRLGPDLTHVYGRLGGTTGMKGWLASPPTPTMQAAYRTHALTRAEIRSLVAYFESASKQAPSQAAPTQGRPFLSFLLIGLGGSLAGMVLLDGIWHKRFRAVRRPLVAKRKGSE